uniref:Integrator complex subunit 2 n=1 Tax=Astyanax mexicanus TaxID=7994 RepID=A0A8B9HR54_ASTMX
MTETSGLQFVSPYAFEAMQKVDVMRLAALSDPELRLLLPCLVRMALCAPADQSNAWAQDKKLILRLLSGVEAVNSIVALLSVDFHALEQDARKEQQLRHKAGGSNGESILVSQLQHGLTLEFEHSDPLRRLRLSLSELLAIMNKVADSNGEFFLKTSELFESPVYLEEVADVLCILQAGRYCSCSLLSEYFLEFPSKICLLVNLLLLSSPWFSGEISSLLQSKNKAWSIARCTGEGEKWLTFRQLRNRCTAPIRKAKSDYFLNQITSSSNPQDFWKAVNFLKNNSQQIPTKILVNIMISILTPRPTDEEAEQLLQLMTSRPPATAAGVRFVSLSFCKLLAFPTLVSTPEQEQLMVMWLSWMIKEEEYFESAAGVSASFGEMLLLVAMYFHSNQLSAIIELVCSTLGMKVIAVTNNLSANIAGFLPIHCIYQLLKSRAFTKHKVSIKDWIFRQLCETSTPLHTQLLPLIDVYINSILTPASKANPEATNQPITEQEILSVFQGRLGVYDGKVHSQYSITTQLLILYYILSYEEALLANTKALALMQKKPKSYSAILMDQIPIKYLIHQAQGLQQELGVILQYFPLTGTLLSSSLSVKILFFLYSAAFQDVVQSGHRLMRILEHLTLLSAGDLIPYAEALTASISLLLEEGVSRRVLQTVNKLWMVLNTVMPRRLWVMTVNALRPCLKLLRQQFYTQNDLLVDPLIVLRCDSRVFRCPPLMDITLHMLNGYLLASKAYLNAHLKETTEFDRQTQTVSNLGLTGQPDTQEVTREELKNALLAAQDSAAVQILLEVCLPSFQEEQQLSAGGSDCLLKSDSQKPEAGSFGARGERQAEGGLLSDLREVQCLICCLLHQMFIADPNIAKLVHFQGYPQGLLPLTVAGIPSMHICLDFIPELLAQPQLEKQIFAIQLLSHLCTQYALPKSLSVARLAISMMGTLLTVLTRDKRFLFFMPTLPCLVSFCRAFPPLYDDVASLLVQVGQVCAADVATKARDIDPFITRLQYFKEKTKEALGSDVKLSKMDLPKRFTEFGRADPDIQLCYCIEATFMDIISYNVQLL